MKIRQNVVSGQGIQKTIYNAKIRYARRYGIYCFVAQLQHEPPSLPSVMQHACLFREKILERSLYRDEVLET